VQEQRFFAVTGESVICHQEDGTVYRRMTGATFKNPRRPKRGKHKKEEIQMSVKALKKQLFAAVAMVIVAAIAVSSSTFAWFAANTTVTATGMNVSAQSDAVFLEIKGDPSGADVAEGTVATTDTEYTTTGTLTMTDVKLFPTNHEAFSAIADITAADSTVATDMDKWFYRYSSDPADKLGTNPSAITPVTVANFNKYVAKVTYSVKLHDDKVTPAYDLYVKSISIPNNAGINAIVVGADGYQEFNASVADVASPTVALANTITEVAQTVTVYLFINGDDTNVYTNNIDALTGAVSMTLGCYTADTIV
jgi:hypothetical protein